LQAAFVIDTYPAARAAAVGPAGRLLLGQLAGAGVVGLALVPMELRRLMSLSPLSSLADFHAKRLRETDNARPTTRPPPLTSARWAPPRSRA
jgi:TRAP-type C4-dicarboxylate transport system substrate-binding protein